MKEYLLLLLLLSICSRGNCEEIEFCSAEQGYLSGLEGQSYVYHAGVHQRDSQKNYKLAFEFTIERVVDKKINGSFSLFGLQNSLEFHVDLQDGTMHPESSLPARMIFNHLSGLPPENGTFYQTTIYGDCQVNYEPMRIYPPQSDKRTKRSIDKCNHYPQSQMISGMVNVEPLKLYEGNDRLEIFSDRFSKINFDNCIYTFSGTRLDEVDCRDTEVINSKTFQFTSKMSRRERFDQRKSLNDTCSNCQPLTGAKKSHVKDDELMSIFDKIENDHLGIEEKLVLFRQLIQHMQNIDKNILDKIFLQLSPQQKSILIQSLMEVDTELGNEEIFKHFNDGCQKFEDSNAICLQIQNHLKIFSHMNATKYNLSGIFNNSEIWNSERWIIFTNLLQVEKDLLSKDILDRFVTFLSTPAPLVETLLKVNIAKKMLHFDLPDERILNVLFQRFIDVTHNSLSFDERILMAETVGILDDMACKNDKVRFKLISVLEKTSLDSQIRISALKSLLNCPGEENDEIKRIIINILKNKDNLGMYLRSVIDQVMNLDAMKNSQLANLFSEFYSFNFDESSGLKHEDTMRKSRRKTIEIPMTSQAYLFITYDLLWLDSSFLPETLNIEISTLYENRKINIFQARFYLTGAEKTFEELFLHLASMQNIDPESMMAVFARIKAFNDLNLLIALRIFDKPFNAYHYDLTKIKDMITTMQKLSGEFKKGRRLINTRVLSKIFSLDVVTHLLQAFNLARNYNVFLYHENYLWVKVDAESYVQKEANKRRRLLLEFDTKMDFLISLMRSYTFQQLIMSSNDELFENSLKIAYQMKMKFEYIEGDLVYFELAFNEKKFDLFVLKFNRVNSGSNELALFGRHEYFKYCTFNFLERLTGMQYCLDILKESSSFNNAYYVISFHTADKFIFKLVPYSLDRSQHFLLILSLPNSEGDRRFKVDLFCNWRSKLNMEFSLPQYETRLTIDFSHFPRDFLILFKVFSYDLIEVRNNYNQSMSVKKDVSDYRGSFLIDINCGFLLDMGINFEYHFTKTIFTSIGNLRNFTGKIIAYDKTGYHNYTVSDVITISVEIDQGVLSTRDNIIDSLIYNMKLMYFHGEEKKMGIFGWSNYSVNAMNWDLTIELIENPIDTHQIKWIQRFERRSALTTQTYLLSMQTDYTILVDGLIDEVIIRNFLTANINQQENYRDFTVNLGTFYQRSEDNVSFYSTASRLSFDMEYIPGEEDCYYSRKAKFIVDSEMLGLNSTSIFRYDQRSKFTNIYLHIQESLRTYMLIEAFNEKKFDDNYQKVSFRSNLPFGINIYFLPSARRIKLDGHINRGSSEADYQWYLKISGDEINEMDYEPNRSPIIGRGYYLFKTTASLTIVDGYTNYVTFESDVLFSQDELVNIPMNNLTIHFLSDQRALFHEKINNGRLNFDLKVYKDHTIFTNISNVLEYTFNKEKIKMNNFREINNFDEETLEQSDKIQTILLDTSSDRSFMGHLMQRKDEIAFLNLNQRLVYNKFISKALARIIYTETELEFIASYADNHMSNCDTPVYGIVLQSLGDNFDLVNKQIRHRIYATAKCEEFESELSFNFKFTPLSLDSKFLEYWGRRNEKIQAVFRYEFDNSLFEKTFVGLFQVETPLSTCPEYKINFNGIGQLSHVKLTALSVFIDQMKVEHKCDIDFLFLYRTREDFSFTISVVPDWSDYLFKLHFKYLLKSLEEIILETSIGWHEERELKAQFLFTNLWNRKTFRVLIDPSFFDEINILLNMAHLDGRKSKLEMTTGLLEYHFNITGNIEYESLIDNKATFMTSSSFSFLDNIEITELFEIKSKKSYGRSQDDARIIIGINKASQSLFDLKLKNELKSVSTMQVGRIAGHLDAPFLEMNRVNISGNYRSTNRLDYRLIYDLVLGQPERSLTLRGTYNNTINKRDFDLDAEITEKVEGKPVRHTLRAKKLLQKKDFHLANFDVWSAGEEIMKAQLTFQNETDQQNILASFRSSLFNQMKSCSVGVEVDRVTFENASVRMNTTIDDYLLACSNVRFDKTLGLRVDFELKEIYENITLYKSYNGVSLTALNRTIFKNFSGHRNYSGTEVKFVDNTAAYHRATSNIQGPVTEIIIKLNVSSGALIIDYVNRTLGVDHILLDINKNRVNIETCIFNKSSFIILANDDVVGLTIEFDSDHFPGTYADDVDPTMKNYNSRLVRLSHREEKFFRLSMKLGKILDLNTRLGFHNDLRFGLLLDSGQQMIELCLTEAQRKYFYLKKNYFSQNFELYMGESMALQRNSSHHIIEMKKFHFTMENNEFVEGKYSNIIVFQFNVRKKNFLRLSNVILYYMGQEVSVKFLKHNNESHNIGSGLDQFLGLNEVRCNFEKGTLYSTIWNEARIIIWQKNQFSLASLQLKEAQQLYLDNLDISRLITIEQWVNINFSKDNVEVFIRDNFHYKRTKSSYDLMLGSKLRITKELPGFIRLKYENISMETRGLNHIKLSFPENQFEITRDSLVLDDQAIKIEAEKSMYKTLNNYTVKIETNKNGHKVQINDRTFSVLFEDKPARDIIEIDEFARFYVADNKFELFKSTGDFYMTTNFHNKTSLFFNELVRVSLSHLALLQVDVLNNQRFSVNVDHLEKMTVFWGNASVCLTNTPTGFQLISSSDDLVDVKLANGNLEIFKILNLIHYSRNEFIDIFQFLRLGQSDGKTFLPLRSFYTPERFEVEYHRYFLVSLIKEPNNSNDSHFKVSLKNGFQLDSLIGHNGKISKLQFGHMNNQLMVDFLNNDIQFSLLKIGNFSYTSRGNKVSLALANFLDLKMSLQEYSIIVFNINSFIAYEDVTDQGKSIKIGRLFMMERGNNLSISIGSIDMTIVGNERVTISNRNSQKTLLSLSFIDCILFGEHFRVNYSLSNPSITLETGPSLNISLAKDNLIMYWKYDDLIVIDMNKAEGRINLLTSTRRLGQVEVYDLLKFEATNLTEFPIKKQAVRNSFESIEFKKNNLKNLSKPTILPGCNSSNLPIETMFTTSDVEQFEIGNSQKNLSTSTKWFNLTTLNVKIGPENLEFFWLNITQIIFASTGMSIKLTLDIENAFHIQFGSSGIKSYLNGTGIEMFNFHSIINKSKLLLFNRFISMHRLNNSSMMIKTPFFVLHDEILRINGGILNFAKAEFSSWAPSESVSLVYMNARIQGDFKLTKHLSLILYNGILIYYKDSNCISLIDDQLFMNFNSISVTIDKYFNFEMGQEDKIRIKSSDDEGLLINCPVMRIIWNHKSFEFMSDFYSIAIRNGNSYFQYNNQEDFIFLNKTHLTIHLVNLFEASLQWNESRIILSYINFNTYSPVCLQKSIDGPIILQSDTFNLYLIAHSKIIFFKYTPLLMNDNSVTFLYTKEQKFFDFSNRNINMNIRYTDALEVSVKHANRNKFRMNFDGKFLRFSYIDPTDSETSIDLYEDQVAGVIFDIIKYKLTSGRFHIRDNDEEEIISIVNDDKSLRVSYFSKDYLIVDKRNASILAMINDQRLEIHLQRLFNPSVKLKRKQISFEYSIKSHPNTIKLIYSSRWKNETLPIERQTCNLQLLDIFTYNNLAQSIFVGCNQVKKYRQCRLIKFSSHKFITDTRDLLVQRQSKNYFKLRSSYENSIFWIISTMHIWQKINGIPPLDVGIPHNLTNNLVDEIRRRSKVYRAIVEDKLSKILSKDMHRVLGKLLAEGNRNFLRELLQITKRIEGILKDTYKTSIDQQVADYYSSINDSLSEISLVPMKDELNSSYKQLIYHPKLLLRRYLFDYVQSQRGRLASLLTWHRNLVKIQMTAWIGHFITLLTSFIQDDQSYQMEQFVSKIFEIIDASIHKPEDLESILGIIHDITKKPLFLVDNEYVILHLPSIYRIDPKRTYFIDFSPSLYAWFHRVKNYTWQRFLDSLVDVKPKTCNRNMDQLVEDFKETLKSENTAMIFGNFIKSLTIIFDRNSMVLLKSGSNKIYEIKETIRLTSKASGKFKEIILTISPPSVIKVVIAKEEVISIKMAEKNEEKHVLHNYFLKYGFSIAHDNQRVVIFKYSQFMEFYVEEKLTTGILDIREMEVKCFANIKQYFYTLSSYCRTMLSLENYKLLCFYYMDDLGLIKRVIQWNCDKYSNPSHYELMFNKN